MNKPCKYTAGQTVWTILDCDHVECTILRTGNNIAGDPEYLVQPIKGNGHRENNFWTAEDRLYDNELDAVKKSLQLWDDKHKKAVEDADYILSHKLAYLSLRKSELEEQQRKSLDNQVLKSGYVQVNAGQCFSSVTATNSGCRLGVKGGTVEDLGIKNGAKVHMESGRLNRLDIGFTAKLVVEGGMVSSASVHGGEIVAVGRSGNVPYLDQVGMNDGARVHLCDAIISNAWVRTSSTLSISSGALASDTIIGSAGKVQIHSGASMVSCTICSGGTLTMYGGGYIDQLKVNEGGIVRYLENAV